MLGQASAAQHVVCRNRRVDGKGKKTRAPASGRINLRGRNGSGEATVRPVSARRWLRRARLRTSDRRAGQVGELTAQQRCGRSSASGPAASLEPRAAKKNQFRIFLLPRQTPPACSPPHGGNAAQIFWSRCNRPSHAPLNPRPCLSVRIPAASTQLPHAASIRPAGQGRGRRAVASIARSGRGRGRRAGRARSFPKAR